MQKKLLITRHASTSSQFTNLIEQHFLPQTVLILKIK